LTGERVGSASPDVEVEASSSEKRLRFCAIESVGLVVNGLQNDYVRKPNQEIQYKGLAGPFGSMKKKKMGN
jgi:hypothetical protein